MDAARFGNGLARRAGCTVIVVWACFAGGCKSGTWGAKPSWWTFGGSGQDPAKLAAAPAFEGAIPKPSETAKPYPTTTTPNGYVLGDKPAAGQVATAGAQSPSIDPPTVTYGSRPAADAGPSANTPASGFAAAPAAAGRSPVTPQVGPYASLPGEPQQPPLAAIPQPPSHNDGGLPPLGAEAGFASAAAAAGPPARVADARNADSWPATSAPADSRYGAASGSRFSSAALTPPPADLPASQPLAPSTPAAAPLATPPMQVPPAVPAPLEALPAATPAAQPLPASPGSPGSRRPDPQYRPGGTSSYRPSRAILADDTPAGGSGVQQASFQTSVGEIP